MYIASFRIVNYKSFRDSPEIALTPGFNVIVGQNNVGKSALVEALSLRAGHKPHRSLTTAPTSRSVVNSTSTTHVAIRLDQSELRELLRIVQASSALLVPAPDGMSFELALQGFQAVLAAQSVTWHGSFTGGGCSAAYVQEYGEHQNVGRGVHVRLIEGPQLAELADSAYVPSGRGNHFDLQLAPQIQSRVYAFRAERFRVGTARFGHDTILRTDASNLPEVLNNLQGNPARFDRLNRLISTIFPVVKRITVLPLPGETLEVVVWTVDPQGERRDLAVPLDDSGSGIGQVVAMLYVVLTAEVPQVIIIDEPQSFLHPGAVRKLFEILKEFPQHQYIITTHSPTALTAADPNVLLGLRLGEGETVVEHLSAADARDLRVVLADVGARPSDVFGADAILWVEGRTEELCFPKIVERLLRRPLRGTSILGVLHTAEFEGRRSEATVELYNRLSAGRGLLPPAVGFIFDREGRSDQDRDDLRRRGNVFFLPRRVYENYLLHPAAIAAVASGIAGFRDTPLTAREVGDWMERNRWDPRYFDRVPAEQSETLWLHDVKGGKPLEDLFTHFSETRVRYDKVRHGVALTEWLLENSPEELQEVAQLIERVIGPREAPSSPPLIAR
jgi:predicted ATPase